MSKRSIWISAGEASGDMHGALLMQALQQQSSQYTYVGMGGEAMRGEGLHAFFTTEELSVMGVIELIKHLPRVYTILKKSKEKIAEVQPDALIVIDAPSFHFPLIKFANTLSIPVFYYISPKIWASRSYRVHFMKRYVKKLFCIFPFEKDFFAAHGLDVEYIGNPLVKSLDSTYFHDITQENNLVSFLPGSRKGEIERLLPEYAKAALLIHDKLPFVRFAILQAPGIAKEFITERWPEHLAVDIISSAQRWEYMKKSTLLVAASGTATFEAALLGTPTLVCYKLSPITFFLAKRFVRVPYVSLPNLILQKEVFPEYLQGMCTGEKIAEEVLIRLQVGGNLLLEETKKDLSELRHLVGSEDAAASAARAILHLCEKRKI